MSKVKYTHTQFSDGVMSMELEALELLEDLPETIHQRTAFDILKNHIITTQQQKRELEELKKDIARFLFLQTGRIAFTGEFTQDFIIENKTHPLAHENAVERNLKKEYKELKEKLELVGEDDE